MKVQPRKEDTVPTVRPLTGPTPQHSTVAVVVGADGSYWTSVLHGIMDAVRRHGNWNVASSRLNDYSPVSLPCVKAVIARLGNEQHRDMLQALKVPVVNVSAITDLPEFPLVSADNEAVGAMAADHLVKLGIRHFAFFGGKEKFSDERKKAFSAAVRAAGRIYHELDWRTGGGMQGWDWTQLLALIEQAGTAPLGILAGNDDAAATLLANLRARGIHVPSRVALLGVDNEIAALMRCTPTLSSVELPTYGIGHRALDLAIAMAEGRERPHNILLPPCRVVVRASTDILAADDASVRSALRYIRTNAHQPLKPADVAKAVGQPLRTLQRRFATGTGTSLQAGIHSARLDHIKHMLRLQPASIKEVAYQCGFANPIYLTKFFTLHQGISPQEYRNQSSTEEWQDRDRQMAED